MKVLFALTYYRPHISGLTIYVERLARALANRGHKVTVLTSHYEKNLAYREHMDGVRVVRVPVLARVNKGCLMPTFPLEALRLIRESQVLSVHLPQFESVLLAWLGWFLRRPVVLTYHCDIRFPPGPFRSLLESLVGVVHQVAGHRADRIVAYTQDYAQHSPFLSRFMEKLEVILPPVAMERVDERRCAQFRAELGLGGEITIGVAARFAAEKGMEHLLEAMPRLEERLDSLKILFAGEYQNVIGENLFLGLQPLIDRRRQNLIFLGVVPPARMPEFYGICDCLVVASVNSTESFGLVQVEAMLSGTPVVATDLPGVRQPVRLTGMGEIVPAGDPEALAAAIEKVVKDPEAYRRGRNEIEALFDINETVGRYEELLAQLIY